MNRIPFQLVWFGLFLAGTLVAKPLAFFEAHCVKCHNAEKAKGMVRLDSLGLPVVAENYEAWREVVHQLQRGDMPPKDVEQRSKADTRQAFLAQVLPALARHEADARGPADPLMRLSNNQLAHSLQDLLGVSRHVADSLIEDPVDKHGYSLQEEFAISGGYMALYLEQLRLAIADATPDPAVRENMYRLTGSDWEKQHYLTSWGMSERSRRNLYNGPKWLEDKFEIPLPPKHEYRMYLKDNRPEGEFRIRITVRNEPPTDAGKAAPQELSLYLDEGFMRPYKRVGSLTVPVKKGPQTFELFGNVRDWVGMSLEPIERGPAKNKKEMRQRLKTWRILSIQNNNALVGFPQPRAFGEADRSGEVYLVRPDDIWIDAFGEQRGLIRSYLGPAAAHPGGKGKTKSIFRDVMKNHGHVVVEQVEFELPYHASWPPPLLQSFMAGDQLERKVLTEKLRVFAARAWRGPLDKDMAAYLDSVLAEEFATGATELEALRNALALVLSDPKFMYLARMGTDARARNHELVSRLAFFLWNGPPDAKLLALADQPKPIADSDLVREVDRLLADPRAERFVADFTAKWIGFSAFDQIAIDPNYYRNWRPTTKAALKDESVAFISELLRNDLSCLNVLDSNFVIVNERVAKHYGMADVAGQKFARQPAPAGRGGVLTQATVLLAYSNGQDAHAVNRGVWLRARLLGDPPSEPPPDVPALADLPAEQVDTFSIKQKLEAHRVGTCYDCHKDIDPWGITMEGFDAIGLPRERILSIGTKRRQFHPVVKSAEIGGQSINGMAALKKYLRTERADDFAYAFTGHVLSHAIGRPPTYRDNAELLRLKKIFQADTHKMRTLIKAIVTSKLFKDTP
ncbi:MAG: DUF1592 domain-containing protein [Verrucomicrobiota bacterium]|jgi:hypothetical protein|nr:DUF1592 domain-containing protein [Verrucomicrobiota bacterium]